MGHFAECVDSDCEICLLQKESAKWKALAGELNTFIFDLKAWFKKLGKKEIAKLCEDMNAKARAAGVSPNV